MQYIKRLFDRIRGAGLRAAAKGLRGAVVRVGAAAAIIALGASSVLAQAVAAAPDAGGGIFDLLSANMPTWAVIALVVVRQLAEIGRKMIPESAIGWPGGLRKVLSVLALYIPNRR